eukprot:scaffold563_cov410-Prasinococcus_capsulatus_cf.AAC.15
MLSELFADPSSGPTSSLFASDSVFRQEVAQCSPAQPVAFPRQKPVQEQVQLDGGKGVLSKGKKERKRKQQADVEHESEGPTTTKRKSKDSQDKDTVKRRKEDLSRESGDVNEKRRDSGSRTADSLEAPPGPPVSSKSTKKKRKERAQTRQRQGPGSAVDEAEQELSSLQHNLDVVGRDEQIQGAEADEEERAEAKKSNSVAAEMEKLRRTVFVGNLPMGIKAKVVKRIFSFYGPVETVRVRSVPLSEDNELPRRVAILTKTNLATGRGLAKGGKKKAPGEQDLSEDEEDGDEDRQPEMGLSVNAYVVFQKRASAAAALAHNMKEVQHRVVRVDFATPNRKLRQAAASSGETTLTEAVVTVAYDHRKSLFVGNIPYDSSEQELIEAFGGSTGVDAVRYGEFTSAGCGCLNVSFCARFVSCAIKTLAQERGSRLCC